MECVLTIALREGKGINVIKNVKLGGMAEIVNICVLFFVWFHEYVIRKQDTALNVQSVRMAPTVQRNVHPVVEIRNHVTKKRGAVIHVQRVGMAKTAI